MGVAQVVEADARNLAALHDAIEQLRDRFRVEESAACVAKYPVIGAVREEVALKPPAPAHEESTGVVVEFDGATAGACLHSELDWSATDVLERARDRQS